MSTYIRTSKIQIWYIVCMPLPEYLCASVGILTLLAGGPFVARGTGTSEEGKPIGTHAPIQARTAVTLVDFLNEKQTNKLE